MIRVSQSVSTQTSNTLSATLKSWLPILQVNLADLDSELKKFKEDIPIIEIESDIEDNFTNKKLDFYRRNNNSKDYVSDNLERFSISKKNIYEILDEQIVPPLFPTKNSQNIAFEIIKHINKDGYFDGNLNLISDKFNTSFEVIEKVRQRFSYLEPYGIASLNIKESFIFQLNHLDINDEITNLTTLLINNLEDLHRFKNKNRFKEAMTIIKKFKTPPAIEYFEEELVVIPDIFINNHNNKIEISLNNSFYPTISIDIKGLDKNNNFLKDKIKQAKNLIDALEMRKKTLHNIALMIVEYQYDFFKGGQIKPMRLKDLADELEFNPSTISRAISNKYLECDFGVIPLKNFFSTAIEEDLSNAEIKNFIITLIKNENRLKPLSDMKMLGEIQERFKIKMVRRTITKYRKELNIFSSSERKKVYQIN